MVLEANFAGINLSFAISAMVEVVSSLSFKDSN